MEAVLCDNEKHGEKTMEFDQIYLGDAYQLIKQVPDKSVDLIVTDPPYEFNGMDTKHNSGVLSGRSGGFDKEIIKAEIDKGIDLSILNEFVRVMKKINIYLWCNKEKILPYLEFFVKDRKCNYEILIWAKDAPIPFCGSHYLVDKEYCLYFWETGATINIPFERGKTIYFTAKNIADKQDYDHPTIKPLEIIKNLILNSSGGGL